MPDFSHLHVHTQYSLLDGAADVAGLLNKARNNNMKAVAITDHGNMFGVFKFVAEAAKMNAKYGSNVKPIVGCEFYLVDDRHKKSFTNTNRDNRYHQLFLAKNPEGYRNLTKLCSLGYMEGLYSKWPRIDKELVLKYHKGLIATTCCIGAEVPQTILEKGETEAEEVFKWWLDLFGEDYYIEIQRHNLPEQIAVNKVLLKFAAKYNVKIIASNDSHYIEKTDADAHDILLCVNTGELKNTPIGDGKNFRFGFPNNEFYFKTQEEMSTLFSDIPEALDNTNEIVDKIEPLKLKRDILLPIYQLPEQFTSQDDYLKHLTFEGAKKRYVLMTPEIEERLNFELHTIKTMGFAGYFLIVQDFINEARNMNVAVGPGRGSAAGSAVAYCVGITNIDPIKYNLLFERFLNPQRKSMPDIDTDFDDTGRQKVIDYVVEKYGKNQVAQIITYGTMAAKSSIKDVARVLDLPLSDANALAKMIPEKPGITLKKIFKEDLDILRDIDKFTPDDLEKVRLLRPLAQGNDIKAATLTLAQKLEGSVRNTGIHAAGIIIAPDDLTNYIPISTSKDTNLLVAQFDGKYIEDAGMLKMDFLGLKNLSIIRDAVELIRNNKGIDINIDEIPLDDLKTFELFQKGDTVGVFQFESDGMSKHLSDLKPNNIEDLIAMNALFRPGPMQFIPNYIERKHGREAVDYPHPLLEDLLRPTYGIMVYQEQIMLAAQIMGGYSLGDADLLRRAMGKKDAAEMERQKGIFTEGAKRLHDVPEEKSQLIFGVMEKFAQYGFNRSHSAAYSVVAYQTAYLKANYPAEYMAAVLTHNMSNVESVAFFMDECKRQGVKVLGPDVNESSYKFSVNNKGEIRAGLGALKGVGEQAVISLIEERILNGPYHSIFDITKRVNLRSVNKRCFESLVYSGAFDSFGKIHRAQYFHQDPNDPLTLIDKAVKFGNNSQDSKNSMQHSLFGESSEISIPEPAIPQCDPWPDLEKLKKEKEVIGIYITGHPLDSYKIELSNFCSHTVSDITDLFSIKNKDVSFAGVVTSAGHKISKNGKQYGVFTIEGYQDAVQLNLFSEDYFRFKHFLNEGTFLFIRGKSQTRYNQENSYEFKISSIMLLSEIREKITKAITISLALPEISGDLVRKIQQTIEANPGTCKLKFNIFEKTDKLSVELPSRKYRIRLSDEFFESLQEMGNIAFKLN